jgi:hypothetical protein
MATYQAVLAGVVDQLLALGLQQMAVLAEELLKGTAVPLHFILVAVVAQ